MAESIRAHRPAEVARTDPELAFTQFASFNDAGFGVFRVASSPGPGPWEMHPDTDELLHVLEGSVRVEVYRPDADNDVVALSAGELVVVPRGYWHRHVDAVDLVEMFHTPGESLHTDDPAGEPRREPPLA